MANAGDFLIDDRVSVEQSQKAVTGLLRHVRKQQQQKDETELLPGREQHVWLVMSVKRMQPMKNLKPYKIPIAHPLVDPRTTSVCLITKDPQREFKDLLESHNIKFISRVVGVQKLKGKFKGFDARRLLLRENGLFLADERVLPLLPGLLGKEWFKAKKQPIPVSLTKKDLKGELEKAISSTYMHQNQGTCTSIKIANISHKDSQVLANLKAAIPAVVARIHGGWDNVQSLNIKTSNSVSLPIWTCPLGSEAPGSRWAGMGIDDGEWTGIGDGGSETAGAADDSPKVTSKKRVAAAEGKELGAKQKKAKRANTPEASGAAAAEDSPKVASKKRVAAAEGEALGAKQKKVKTANTREAAGAAGAAAEDSLKVTSKEKRVAAAEGGELGAKQKKVKIANTPEAAAVRAAVRAAVGDSLKVTGKERVAAATGKELGAKQKKVRMANTPEVSTPTASVKAVEPRSVQGDSSPSAKLANSPPTAVASHGNLEKRPFEKALKRDELKGKKAVLEHAKLGKKKRKLVETKRSAQKSIKTQMIGRVKM